MTKFTLKSFLIFFIHSLLFPCECNVSEWFDKEKMREGTCLDLKPADNLDPIWQRTQDAIGWYYVMGNKHHVNAITESLTGKPVKDDAFLKTACLHLTRNEMGFTQYGYGNKADYECKTPPTGKRECIPTQKSTNYIWAAKRGTTEATIVWTNNKDVTLGYRCHGGQRIWSVRSSKPTIDEDIKLIILEQIKKDGFKLDYAVILPNEECPEFLVPK